jgi:guanosine-3',5'-bis(diphosphate) 3'-pyrophosphohydrolase
MNVQSLYQKAIRFAAYRHMEKNQKVKGTKLPYVVHLSNVAMEVFMASSHTEHLDLEFAIPVALLHDTIEDTSTTLEELDEQFGTDISRGVLALTKNEKMPKELQTIDSLARIKQLRKEVWAVKLADRITNLQEPPSDWSSKKRLKYLEDSKLILHALKGANKYLAARLKEKIEEYPDYIG